MYTKNIKENNLSSELRIIKYRYSAEKEVNKLVSKNL